MDGRDVTCASPTASVSSPLSKFGTLGAQQVTSPYLSESAHVFSLQHPVGKVLEDGSGEDAKVSRNSDATEVDVQRNENSPDPILDVLSAETASRPPSIRSRMSRKSRRSRRGDNFEPQDELRDSIDSECIPTKHNIIHDKDHELDNSSRSYVRLSWISTWSHNLGKTGAWLKEELAHSKLSHKIFSRDHAHRRHSRPSLCAISSSSRRSSIKNTHKDGARIFLGTNNSFRSTNIQFPGGEATRVSTPPLDEDTADGKPRGFFTSMTAPEHHPASSPSPTQSSSHSSPRGYQRSSFSSQPREWWDPMPPRSKRRAQQHQQPCAEDFAFDVPEHLPNSPLCPANGRHRSGGTGMCVYHGRRRAKSSLRDANRRDTGTVLLTGGLY